MIHGHRSGFIRSMQPLIGSVIGVGIFGLPFVFAQAGFAIALIHMVVLTIVSAVALLAYGDIVKNQKDHPRFVAMIERYLGKPWAWVATFVMFGATWGAMIAYIILGGEFAYHLFGGIGGSVELYQVLFYLLSAGLIVGGLGFITRIELWLVGILLITLAVIMVGSVPAVDISNFTYIVESNWFLPFGVLMFAFGGIGVVPEMADVLGKKKFTHLTKSIVISLIIIATVYLLFAGVVSGVTGLNTTDDAIAGLGNAVGGWVLIVGSIVGLISVLTSFLMLGVQLMNTLIVDYKRRYMWSWLIVVSVPFIIYLLGARSFIQVIGYTGAILGGGINIFALAAYLKAKNHVCMPKRCLAIPSWLIWGSLGVLVFGLLVTVIGG